MADNPFVWRLGNVVQKSGGQGDVGLLLFPQDGSSNLKSGWSSFLAPRATGPRPQAGRAMVDFCVTFPGTTSDASDGCGVDGAGDGGT